MKHFIIGNGCIAFSVLTLAVGIIAPSNCRAQDTVTSGTGSFIFEDAANRAITVWYYAPLRIKPSTPVLFVMHGVERNGREYRDAWTEEARRKKVVLLVPEFSKSAFPGSDEYSLGDVFSDSGTLNDRDQWAFTTIERVFDKVKADTKLTTSAYSIYGHSAGAQFVHRLVLFMPQARIEKAVAANAGWYTMPDFEVSFPYGLGGTPVTADALESSLRKNLTVLLGSQDTDENHKYLRKTPEAMAQGKHRLARGKKFFEQGKEQAGQLGVQSGWDIKTVPGVGHSNSGMTPAALQVLY
ncbi:MAG: hypothetical protein JXB04_02365 [Kiritimatiellae bacterium]|nr:hypothetical protein [Kiritimatiellia bacterium]